MNWKDKIRCAIEKAKNDELFTLVFDWSKGPADEAFLGELKKDYPFCDTDVLDLLRIGDGFYINHFSIAGSPLSRFRSIKELSGFIQPYAESDEYLPLANESSGRGIYLQDRERRIHLTYSDTGDTRLVANSYKEFIGDILMGDKYWSLFPTRLENDWTRFLRAEGWLKS